MRIKTMGWCVGLLCPLFAAGTAWAEDQKEVTGTDVVKQMAGKPECGDAGVTVAFKTDSAELDENAKGALNGVATWLNNDKDRTLRLQGFADPTGDAEANLVLSERRADAVKNYLVGQGIDSTRVQTVGRGEHIDHLPADGRAVTFLACQPPKALAQGETVTPPTPLEQAEAEMPQPPATVVVVPPPVAPVPMAPPPPAPKPSWARGFGWALMAGGGYQDFTDSTMRSVTNGGATWDARVVGGTHSIIGFEAAYVGSARELSQLGITANNPALVSHGVEGNVRLNAPIRSGASLFEPYAFGGVGYSNLRISNYNSNTGALSSFNSTDNVLNLPVGGGFAYAYKAFIADVRGGWTTTFRNDLLTSDVNQSGRLNHWNFGGQAGFMF
jgi:hypothetical protein